VLMAIPDAKGENWGEIDGEMLSPSEDSRTDRVRVSEWFVDEALERFADAGYENLRLVGFYWQQENGNILPKYGKMIADHIHSCGLGFYWIPYFEAYNWNAWASYGFDGAWLQPNYLFTGDAATDRLRDACDLAAGAGMGVEMEIDDTQSLQRMTEYWDVFGERGILEKSPVAYYVSGNGLPMRDSHTLEDWRAFYQRVADTVAVRQKRFYE